MARGSNGSPIAIIIILIFILFILPTCICGGLFVVGFGTTMMQFNDIEYQVDEFDEEVEYSVKEFTADLESLDSATELVPEAEGNDNPSELTNFPEPEEEGSLPEE
ncbi:MAG: hypothetical protein COA78_13740 [Blastopirellula sp.]|nr:MAG: hypothetical protein COA78_13740 [Blastopirellula sp.]